MTKWFPMYLGFGSRVLRIRSQLGYRRDTPILGTTHTVDKVDTPILGTTHIIVDKVDNLRII